MSILPISQISVFINKKKLTIFEKFGEGGKIINFDQSRQKVTDEIQIALGAKQQPHNKQVSLNLIFGTDLTFIYSSKKSPNELFSLADQVLPYSTDEAEYFVALGKSVNTLFACPNPVKNLLAEVSRGNLNINKSYPLILLYSPKYLIKIPAKSEFILSIFDIKGEIFTMVNFQDELVDFQIYPKSDPDLLIDNLIKYYSSDPDFNIQIDTVLVNSEVKGQFEGIKLIRSPQNFESVENIIISNFHHAKLPTILTIDDVKKQESDSNVDLAPDEKKTEFHSTHPKTSSSKIILAIVVSLLIIVSLGIVLFIQFQSTRSKNVRRNGTVAPSVSTTPTIIPSKKFSQPQTVPQIEIIPSTQSAQ